MYELINVFQIYIVILLLSTRSSFDRDWFILIFYVCD